MTAVRHYVSSVEKALQTVASDCCAMPMSRMFDEGDTWTTDPEHVTCPSYRPWKHRADVVHRIPRRPDSCAAVGREGTCTRNTGHEGWHCTTGPDGARHRWGDNGRPVPYSTCALDDDCIRPREHTGNHAHDMPKWALPAGVRPAKWPLTPPRQTWHLS